MSEDSIRRDPGSDVGSAGRLQASLRDDDRIVAAMEGEAEDGQLRSMAPLCRREILLLAYKFIGEHSDTVLRKVLKAWQRKVSGSKTERITRAYLYFRVALIGGEEAGDLFRNCKKDGLCLFKDFDIWLEKNRLFVQRKEEVPSDADLMRTFRPAEIAH